MFRVVNFSSNVETMTSDGTEDDGDHGNVENVYHGDCVVASYSVPVRRGRTLPVTPTPEWRRSAGDDDTVKTLMISDKKPTSAPKKIYEILSSQSSAGSAAHPSVPMVLLIGSLKIIFEYPELSRSGLSGPCMFPRPCPMSATLLCT